MDYLTLMIAIGVIVLFGYWSGRRRLKTEKRQKSHVSKVYPLSRAKNKTKLRRVK